MTFSLAQSVPKDLLLIRHGETAWNRERRLQSHLDIPLSASGEEQVRWAGKWIARAMRLSTSAALWTSPIVRARQSAALLRESLADEGWPQLEVQVHAGLREIDAGAFTGRTLPSLAQELRWQDYLIRPYDTRFPDGESVREVQERAHGALLEILDVGPATVIAVTHGGIIRALIAALLGLPESVYHAVRIGNASVTHLRCAQAGVRVLSLNGAENVGALLADAALPPR